jgi:ribosomal-protein-alanine N-acetyltransferase
MTTSQPPRPHVPHLSELPLVIDTPRLQLRPLAPTDVEDLWPHCSSQELTKYLSWAAHRNRDETRAFIEEREDELAKDTSVVWAIVHEGHAAGCIGLHGIRWDFRTVRIDRAELGYWIAIALWRKGLMTEAATAVTRWGFETLGLHKITVGCLEDNLGSKRVIEKVGYRYLCKQEDDYWRDGRWYGHFRYELLASEWSDSTRTLKFSRPLPT